MTSVQTDQSAPLTLHGEEILFPALPYDIKERAEHATHDGKLQEFVNRATNLRDSQRRDACFDAFGVHYDDMRNLAGRIKQHTLDHLDHYLEKFIDNATNAGAHVHFAKDATEANRICVGIAAKHNSKLCVKSKSMVTEETHLVPALQNIGCETVETDLGEFILQIDNDAPSHIVTPMIHKDRVAVAEAFTRELGVDYTTDPDELTKIAREFLRSKYRQADIGISGGNFLVAETGSVVICTNEGNGRLSTSVPRVHVACVGIEKVVPDLERLAILLKMLARSSTGQPLTVYTHIMTGPKRSDEPDGPEEMHIILIDNGRVEVLAEETREMLRCIRCGACLNACPVYRKIGGHAYGAVYSGPIGAILTPMFKGLENYKDLPHASSLCGACYEACPVQINIPKYLIKERAMMVEGNIENFSDRMFYRIWAKSLLNPTMYRLGGWMQKRMFRLMASRKHTLRDGNNYSARGWLDTAPGKFSGWTDERDLPTPPKKSFRQWWNGRL